MTVADTFSDGNGNVIIGGEVSKEVRVIGWSHDPRCHHYSIATFQLAVFSCECDGRPLLGFMRDWPMEPPSPPESIVIEVEEADQ